jgi:hypothetical protein
MICECWGSFGQNTRISEFRFRRGAGYRALLSWGYREDLGPWVSVDDANDICELAYILAGLIVRRLPWRYPGKEVLNADMWMPSGYQAVQRCAYAIEALVNPRKRPFGSEERANTFCMSECKKFRAAAKRFLAAFDGICVHYGWRADISGAALQDDFPRQILARFVNDESDDDVMVPEPPVIDMKMFLALRRAADNYWAQAIKDIPRRFGPSALKVLTKATLPPELTVEALAIGLVFLHSKDKAWTDERIAKALGISRGHLYRLPGFKQARATLREIAKNDLPPGESYIDRETGSRRHDAHVGDDHLEALENDDD